MPTPQLPISRFSSSLHTATFARCHLPDDLVQMLRLPLLKELSLVVVYLSEAPLHSIIHSSCPALERLLIVLGIEIPISCLQIKSPHLKSIGICFEGHQLIIKDAPSFQRLLLDNCYTPSQITVVFAPKLETLGVIHDPFNDHKELVFGSSLFQVPYIIIYTFVIISCIFICAHKFYIILEYTLGTNIMLYAQ